MRTPRRWEPLAAVPILAGLFWLLADDGLGWLFWALIPGVLMLGSGVSLLLWPGDSRQTQFLAMGGLLGVLIALPAMLAGGFWLGLTGLVFALASFLVAGRLALRHQPEAGAAPPPDKSMAMDAKVALDEALVGYFVNTAKIPSGAQAEELGRRASKLEQALETGGWLSDPASLHRSPPAPDHPELRPARTYGRDYEQLRYRSGFVPHGELPGAQEWVNHHSNNEAVAWLLRHKGDAPRPWLLCVHGYRMGLPWMDFGLFSPGRLHHKYGLNLLMPVLPLHGPRRIGLRSGDHYLDGDPLDLLHAQTQALWDLRRAIAWIRAQEPGARIGVLGYSLGGYNTALLATAEADLDFAIAGIPVAEFSSLIWGHLSPEHLRYFAAQGLDLDRYRRILSPVSPLSQPVKLAVDRRYIFAGTGDRLVPPHQALKLAAHWAVPVQWYQGGHLSFRGERNVTAHIEAAMQRAGWPVTAQMGRPGYT
jgi:hypothetical protein